MLLECEARSRARRRSMILHFHDDDDDDNWNRGSAGRTDTFTAELSESSFHFCAFLGVMALWKL